MIRPPPRSTPFPYTALFRSETVVLTLASDAAYIVGSPNSATVTIADNDQPPPQPTITIDRKSTRLNSSHSSTSYAAFCLNKKTETALAVRYSVGGTAANGTD